MSLQEKEQQLLTAAKTGINAWFKKRPDKRLSNIVFYWGDESCELAYVNNTRINGQTDDELAALMGEEEFGAWLDGAKANKRFFDFINKDHFEVFSRIKACADNDLMTTDYVMYRICAL